MKIAEIQARADSGGKIDRELLEAIALAHQWECPVVLTFNDIRLECGPISTVDAIIAGWEEIKRRQAELRGASVAMNGTVQWGRTD